MSIERVAVIGAGVMGASIAAHIANAGVPVDLLDVVPEGAGNRNGIAESAMQKLLKTEPPPLMHAKNARRITAGNIEDHLERLSEADWIIEAVVEDLTIKRQLYQRIAGVIRDDAVLSSNTSTLPLNLLTAELPDALRQRFMITHFFNPPRYMRLLELVAPADMSERLLQSIAEFADLRLGKGCVNCNDTPGFIANRIGTFWAQCGLLTAIELGLTVEEVDGVMSQAFGLPKTGLFGMLDLVGLDLVPHILAGFKRVLPADDAFHRIIRAPEMLTRMIEDGYTGRKGKGGFYRLQTTGGLRQKEALDLMTGEYRASVKAPAIEKAGDLQALLSGTGKIERFAWRVWSDTLSYTAGSIPEIAGDIVAVDRAMKLGYNWKHGPFELLDRIGPEWLAGRMRAEGRPVPSLLGETKAFYRVEAGKKWFRDVSGQYLPVPRPDGVLSLADIKLQGPAVLSNASASLWDIGDGIACLEFHSKMNTLDMASMQLIRQSIDKVAKDFTALVIYNEADNFSAGANLTLLMAALDARDESAIEDLIRQGQQTYQSLKYAPFPVVGAPSGLALGGGCEILLHCDAIQAHAELYTGLVEVGVGLIPGWGGCKEYLRRQLQQPKSFGGPIPPISKAFETIGTAKVSQSAFEAKELLFLSPDDEITMNRERLLADVKVKALALVPNYTPPQPFEYRLPGKTAKILMTIAAKALRLAGKASEYDLTIAERLAGVLSGGDTDTTETLSEADLLALELEAFMHLVHQPGTRARLEHMLKTGKPLRN